ncbi:hypothetical protein HG536_0G00480 [Torulaspora globosa]|uniref:Uncharacterized protein n=1 Tax=Torulaspora globosa TaxID=48254 RepID=A0A7G3ZL05_9SACH|nr:uncharacterized protein HG536_0G00480 [Torulaspora globosa]QLL34191.1 hypothetical protein HG536_0G00480 [Torulaspora globosa]
MMRSTHLALRSLLRTNVRFYRKRGPSTSHITALKSKKLLRDERSSNLNGNGLNEMQKGLRGLEFEELDVEKSLEDVMLGYFERASSTFKRSSSNFKSLKKQLTAEGVTDDDKANVLFSYLLQEASLEIKRFETMNKEQLRALRETRRDDMLHERVDSEKELEAGLVSSLFMPSSENETYLMSLDLIYEILTDLNNKKKPIGSKVLSIEQLVEAFELAKIVPIEGRRKRGIFLAGNLIYARGNVRMDPVNESFYIESLVNYGLYRKAYNLFETNREKVDERWWYEMGMMVALRANYLQKFERLLAMLDEKFPGYPYVSPRILKLAIKKKLFLRDLGSANALTTRLLDIVTTFGLNSSQDRAQKTVDFASEDEADMYLNERELPTSYDLLTVADYHLFRKNFNTAYKVMATYLDKVGNSELGYQYFVVRMKLNLLRDIKSLKSSLQTHMSPEIADFCLEKLQNTFDRIVKEANVDNSMCQDLLFDSIDSLVKDPLLTKTVEGLIVSSLRDKDLLSPSKSFHSVLKLLLASGREADAMKVLSSMEQASKQCGQHKAGSNEHFFSEANAHHYAEFIEYYALQAVRRRKQREAYQKKVSQILDRMSSLGVPYNSVFLSKLLMFYRQSDDFENSFTLINRILEEKRVQSNPPDADRTSFYNRRDITRGLYAEIWKLCSSYYYVFARELHTVEMKSNYGVWKENASKIVKATKVHPNFSIRTLFRTMVNDDNILPDERMYFTILVTFMKKRDWQAIPGILAAMIEVHGLSFPKNLSDYLRKGLDREHIMLERRQLKGRATLDQLTGAEPGFSDQLPKNNFGPEGTVKEINNYSKLIEDILLLQKQKYPDDKNFFLVSEALEELQFSPSNMQELIDNVHSRDSVI